MSAKESEAPHRTVSRSSSLERRSSRVTAMNETLAALQKKVDEQDASLASLWRAHEDSEKLIMKSLATEIATVKVNMESAAMGQFASELKTPAASANAVSLMIDESADLDDIKNFYSFCVLTMLRSESPLNILAMFVGLTIMMLVQVVYAYGFSDASQMLFFVSMYPGFNDQLDVSMLYPSSIVPGTFTPLINLAASISSLFLLCLLMKNDTEGTLLTPCPLEALLLPSLEETEARKSLPMRILAGLGRTVLCLVLQLFWTVRAIFLPVYACLGTAGGFCASKQAQEIVLNSVAIAFVFELDEFSYVNLIGKPRRLQFEETPPPPTSPLSPFFPSGRAWVARWCWLIFFCDLSWGIARSGSNPALILLPACR